MGISENNDFLAIIKKAIVLQSIGFLKTIINKTPDSNQTIGGFKYNCFENSEASFDYFLALSALIAA